MFKFWRQIVEWPGFWIAASLSFIGIVVFHSFYPDRLTLARLGELTLLWVALTIAIFLFGYIWIDRWTVTTEKDIADQEHLETWGTKKPDKESQLIKDVLVHLRKEREKQKNSNGH